ncbi:hypothetical protein TNCV_5039691 [Trichonephila clavipes]|nr:hypothetical protein TNCV_5039691 [Trichonephila clavipes]
MPDAETIAAVTVNKKMQDNDENVKVEDALQTPRISHSETLKIVDTALQYFQQQGALMMDLLFCSFDVFVMKQETAQCSTQDNRALCISLKHASSFCKVSDYVRNRDFKKRING